MTREFRAKLKPNPTVETISKVRDELLRQYTRRYGVEMGVDLVLSAESTEEVYEITLAAVPRRAVLVVPELPKDEEEDAIKRIMDSFNSTPATISPIPIIASEKVNLEQYHNEIERQMDKICAAAMVPKHLLFGDPEPTE